MINFIYNLHQFLVFANDPLLDFLSFYLNLYLKFSYFYIR